ncbi:MAG: hypothetical protein KU37_11595 [Sulfuricurvum sp. PC08-66]|nr:MAG: hypothetical protein KU37_11595 [Sulfuricurvum sp. PC08-66]
MNTLFKISVLIFLCFSSSTLLFAHDRSEKLILVQGIVLNLYYEDKYIEIKRAELFYGYGMLDKNRVFIAYQDPEYGAEAVARLDVLNVHDGNTTKLTIIGSSGESHFDVYPYTGHIAYNDSDGIHLMIVHEDNSIVIHDLVKDSSAWGVFWVDKNTIGTMLWEEKRNEFKKIDVSHLLK